MVFVLFSPRHGVDVAASEYQDFLGATGLAPEELEQRMLDSAESTLGDLSRVDGIFVGGSPYTMTNHHGSIHRFFQRGTWARATAAPNPGTRATAAATPGPRPTAAADTPAITHTAPTATHRATATANPGAHATGAATLDAHGHTSQLTTPYPGSVTGTFAEHPAPKPADPAAGRATMARFADDGLNFEDEEGVDADEQLAVCAQLARLTASPVPVMYVCFGAHLLAHLGGGRIARQHPEDSGPTEVYLTPEAAQDPLCHNLPPAFNAFTGHTENIEAIPSHATLLATGNRCPVQMYRWGPQQWATQFHAEMDADGLRRRMEFYLDYGYFSPAEFDSIVATIQGIDVSPARQVLANFVMYCRERSQG